MRAWQHGSTWAASHGLNILFLFFICREATSVPAIYTYLLACDIASNFEYTNLSLFQSLEHLRQMVSDDCRVPVLH